MKKNEKLIQLKQMLDILSTKNWDALTKLMAIFNPDKIDEMLYILVNEPNVAEEDFIKRTMVVKKK